MSVARRGVRGGLAASLAAILVMAASAGPAGAGSSPIRMTVEVAWSRVAADSTNAQEAVGATLDLSAGNVIEALPWPESDDPTAVHSLPTPVLEPGGSWRLGQHASGRVRARIEAPIDATLSVQAGATTWTTPLLGLLDGPQISPADGGTVVEVRRLDWDVLNVQVACDGTVAPGAVVPVSVGFNVLTPEPTEVNLSLSARLRPIRGERPIWEDSRRQVVSTNATSVPTASLSVPMPTEPGTYVLELSASWAPHESQGEGTRLSRWWRRVGRRPVQSVVRRISLAVVDPGFEARGPTGSATPRRPGTDRSEVLVDSAELGRPRGLRPRPEGRSPASSTASNAPWAVPDELLVDPPRRERIWSLLSRVGSDYRPLAEAGSDGISWTASPLKVSHVDRPHRLELTVVSGDPSNLAVAVVAPGARPRLLLDARGSGPVASGVGRQVTLSWTIWPDAADPVLIVANRSPGVPLWLGDARLFELAHEPAALPLIGPPPDGGRSLAVRMTAPLDLERFGGASDDGPDDPMARGRHLAAYLGSIGASTVILPAARPDREIRSALEGQAGEDPIGPDRRSALISVLNGQGYSVMVEVRLDDVTLPGLPPPGSYEAEAGGLVRLDRSGKGEAGRPTYNVLRPEVQRAMSRFVVAALGDPVEGGGARPAGILLRLGPGPTLPGKPDTGFDDATYARFVSEAITGGVAPGLDPNDPDRFAARHEFVTGPASVPWIRWRSRRVGSVYAGLSAAVAEAEPGARLLVVTPGLDDGPAGAEARRFDRDGLPPDAAWRSIGLDLADWSQGVGPPPIILRGASVGVGGLDHDLATHPALDAQVLSRPQRGLLLGLDDSPASLPVDPGGGSSPVRLSASPPAPGARGDEAFGHALAALDAEWVVVSVPALAGQEERLRPYSRVIRALPKPDSSPPGLASGGVVGRVTTSGEASYLCLANDTPFLARVVAVIAAHPSATVLDLGRGNPIEAGVVAGGRRVTVDLRPFGVSALRISVPGARIISIGAAYENRRELHRQAVARRLQALSSGGPIAELNPGFEPESVVRQASSAGEPGEMTSGWFAEGAAGASVVIDQDRPRSGRGSLLLTAPEAPAAATSPAFSTQGTTTTLRAFVRTDPPDAEIRVRIESEPGEIDPLNLAADLPGADRQEWSPLALRAPGLPGDPNAMLRLRFELRTPGRLWVDDLSMTGPGLAQARSCLAAALQAYEEGRFADFARLSRSHWVVEAGGAIEPDPPPPLVAPLAGETSTDLPSRTRLR